MRIKPIFEITTGISAKQYAVNSIAEAQDKISRLKEFYQDPHKDGSERWWRAEFCLDYLRQYKVEGTKRADKLTENIMHELNQLLLHKSLVEAGTLPRKVTHEVINGKQKYIPIECQSIERLFCSTAIHDIDEDFHKSSVEEFREYMILRTNYDGSIPMHEKEWLIKQTEADCKAMDILTFGRKTIDSQGNEVKIHTFNNDRNLYMDAVETDWATAATKGSDKLDSLTSRYGLYGDYFSIEKDMLHIDETHRLFKYRKFMENMADRYPQMGDYFRIVDAKLEVADHCLHSITLYHPDRLKNNPDAEVNPLTAKIDINRSLQQAILHSELLDEDAHIIRRMIKGFQQEAVKHPQLKNIVDQMVSQYECAINNHYRPNHIINNDNINDIQ